LSWQDIKLRYRRSQLGPFWITLSMAITIYTMGFLYGHLFHMDLHKYFPYLAGGMLTWSLISTCLIESGNAFIEGAGMLKQIKLPYSIFVLRIVARNLIIFAHNLLAIVPVLLLLHIKISLGCLSAAVLGLLLIASNAFIYGFILAMIGCRFRDFSPTVASLVQVAFFVTPVMWSPLSLSSHYQRLVVFNPFSDYVEVLRSPLTGHYPSLISLSIVLALTMAGSGLLLLLFKRVRKRIVYWL
jgi:ABC-type polysaccharide/polyol phosphate export permease